MPDRVATLTRHVSRPGDAPLDRWSWVHVTSGMVLAVVTQRLWLVVALLALYEAFEAVLRRVRKEGEGLFEYESWPNIWGDVLVGIIGWSAVRLALIWGP